MAEAKLTKLNFEQEVLRSAKPVLVDFWATWCGPCKMIAPVLEELAQSHEASLKVGKVNVDEEIELAKQFGVVSIPTLVVMENGQLVTKSVGAKDKDEILDLLEL